MHKDKPLVVAPNPRQPDQLLAQLLRCAGGTPSSTQVPTGVGARMIGIFRRGHSRDQPTLRVGLGLKGLRIVN